MAPFNGLGDAMPHRLCHTTPALPCSTRRAALSLGAALAVWLSASRLLAQPTDADDEPLDATEVEASGGEDHEPGSTPQQPLVAAERLRTARQAFLFGSYEELVTLLDPVVADATLLASLSQLEQAEVYRLLGLGLLLKPGEERERAAEAFFEMLKRQKDFEFVAGVVDDRAIALLREVREAHPDLFPRPDTNPGVPGIVYIEREVVSNPFWLNLLPPLGQFQNGEPVKGYFILLTEGIALVTNVTTFVIVEQLRGSNGLYTPSNGRAADAAQDVQIISFYVFLGIVALGIGDAWSEWEEQTVRIRRLDKPPPELARGAREGDDARVGVEAWFSPEGDATDPLGQGDAGLSGAVLRLELPF